MATHPSKFGLTNANHATSGRASLISGGVQIFENEPLTASARASFATEYTKYDPAGGEDRQGLAQHPDHDRRRAGRDRARVLHRTGARARCSRCSAASAATPTASGSRSRSSALLLHTMLYADFLEDPVTWMLLAVGGSLAVAARAAAAPEDAKQHLRAVA